MKLLLSLILGFSLNATADQFKTVSEDLSSKNYQASIRYPEFFSNSVATGYAKINHDLRDLLVGSGCDPEDAASAETPYDYSATARVVALNANYVGLEVSDDSYCGGAHPNYMTYNLTFDARTGDQIDMAESFPQQKLDGEDVDWEAFDKYQLELATIMYDHRTPASPDAEDCTEGLSREEAIEQIQSFFPLISGLAKNKTVVIRTFPPHVAAVCASSVRVSYEVINKYMAKDSVLHGWLKP